MGKKIYMNKLPLVLFIFVVSLAASGTATAATDQGNSLPDAYVVESGKMYTGTTALQDSIDSDYTQDGYNIYLQPGNYSQPITIDKNLRIKGMGANPEDTVIELTTDGSVVNVPDGVTVTLKNLAIINRGSGTALSDSGIINMINCVIIDSYMEPPVNTTEMNNSTDAVVTASADSNIVNEYVPALNTDFTAVTDSTITETPIISEEAITPETTDPLSSETATTETQTSTPADNNIPLTTMAYGMLMVVGGVVLPRKRN